MKYHLIGDQGVSMRGLKRYLIHLGHIVTGSDIKSNGHKKENVDRDVDVVVRTSAVNPGSPGWVEVEAANEHQIPVIKRSQLIKDLTKGKKLIAVSGMHGKTTITTMAGLLLTEAGFDPTVLVGEEVRDFGNDVVRIGRSDWFVLEACEYDRSFLDFYPNILILTNIEEEHLDTYPGGLPEILEAYSQYIKHVPSDGLIIACADDENVRRAIELSGTGARVIFYGKTAEKYNYLDFQLTVPGEHNQLNALAIIALGDCLEIDKEKVKFTLQRFSGAHRRFEKIGQYNGADLIDDYGHHPTEIKATLQALAERYIEKKKIVVFWPHQYKRIKPLLDQFATAFSGADMVIIKPIFFVPGRDEVLEIDSKDLVQKISEQGCQARYFETDNEIIDFLRKELNSNSVLLTIGIPPVYKISKRLLGEGDDD